MLNKTTNGKKTKWCNVCGASVDMRRDYELPEKLKVDVKNTDYHYIHKGECYEKVRKELLWVASLLWGKK